MKHSQKYNNKKPKKGFILNFTKSKVSLISYLVSFYDLIAVFSLLVIVGNVELGVQALLG